MGNSNQFSRILKQEIIESEYLAATASDKVQSTNASTVSSGSTKPHTFLSKFRSNQDDRSLDVMADECSISSATPKRFTSKAKYRSHAADTVHPSALAGPSGHMHTVEQLRLTKPELRSEVTVHDEYVTGQSHGNQSHHPHHHHQQQQQPASSIEIPMEHTAAAADSNQMPLDVSAGTPYYHLVGRPHFLAFHHILATVLLEGKSTTIGKLFHHYKISGARIE